MRTPTDRAGLAAAVAAGAHPDYLPFWAPELVGGAEVGPGVLSQWWPAPFVVDAVTYPTAEHWMMAGKARVAGDAEAEAVVLADPDPAAAKAAGRAVRGFDSATWRARRVGVVVAGNAAKFAAHPALGRYLVATGDTVLVEASPEDLNWGAGVVADDPRLPDPAAWPGENLLGFALMAVREDLRAGSAPAGSLPSGRRTDEER